MNNQIKLDKTENVWYSLYRKQEGVKNKKVQHPSIAFKEKYDKLKRLGGKVWRLWKISSLVTRIDRK